MSEQYFTVVYVLKEGQNPSDILKDLEFGKDIIFCAFGNATVSQDNEESE